MKHYCCIIEITTEGTCRRVTMAVACSDWPIIQNGDLLSAPPIVGRVTSLTKSLTKNDGPYLHAFTIAMAREIEAAMRRGSFPNANLEIPDIFATNLMKTNLPEPIGYHFLGMIAYAFSI